jgi:REP element-mobilizing transposase RayT
MEPLPKRKPIRLKGYDYSQKGCYFITICTKNHEFLFGDIIDGKMILNEYGKIATGEIELTAQKRPYAIINNYVVMPNHVHILISLKWVCTLRHLAIYVAY